VINGFIIIIAWFGGNKFFCEIPGNAKDSLNQERKVSVHKNINV